MANVLDSLSFHQAALSGNRSETVRYHVGGDSFDVTAVVGATPIGFDLGNGVIQSWQATDFFIEADDLVLAGEEFLPEVGHRIVRTIRGVEVAFEVMPADDQRPFYPSDEARNVLRIHTKEVCG